VSVATWAHRHARSILFLLAVLVGCGVLATRAVPVSLFPRVDFPRIRINLEAGERPAERMAVEVTRPVEASLRGIPGVRGVESRSSRGAAEIWLTFDWGQDMAAALLQAEGRVNRILPSLPAGTSLEVRRMDPSVFSTISYSLTSDVRPLTELHDLAQYQLRPLLLTVPGVARIDVQGGAVEEYRVTVDPAKLAAHGLAASDVAAALSSGNVLSAVGQVEDRSKLYLVVTDTRLRSLDEIGASVLRSGASGVVRLSDVATVRREPAPLFTRATADGKDAVLFDVYQQPGANTIEIADRIRRTLAQEQKHLPADVRIVNWYDQSDLITESARSVRDAVLIGVALAAVVLLLFLRNWRITLVAALAVPVVLAVTALLLYLLGRSFNIMTLGGMAAAVGLIIDDAIVISEHIVRRLHARGPAFAAAGAQGRVLRAAEEFRKPLIGSSLSTIVIHIPPAFMVGVAGAFFAALSLSMASSLVISFVVAWLAIPVLAAHFLRGHQVERLAARAEREHRIYPAIMRRVLAWPALVLLLIVPLLAGGYLAYERLPSGFMPTMDEGGFVIDYVAPPGTSLTETDRLLRRVEAILAKTPEVQTWSRRTGFAMGGDFSEPNTGDFFVRLKPYPRRPIEQVMDDVEKQVTRDVPGLDLELSQLMEDIIGDITGRPEPVVVNLFCEDPAALNEAASKVADAVAKVPGVDEVKNGIVPAGDALEIEVDRVKASLEGVDPEAMTRSLEDLVSGSVTTQVQQGEKLVDVRVWIPKDARRTTRDVGKLRLRAPDGHLFPLNRVAALHTISGEPEITRQDLKRVVSVTGRSDRDLGSTIRDVRAVLDRPGFLPAGVRYTLGGMYEQQQIAFRGLVKVLAAATALVFLLLLFLYESFRVAVAILLTTLLAMAAVFLGLWVSGTELNVSSLMGMVMIVGNVTEVAIFYYSEYADFPHEGSRTDRLIAAGSYRMRAITMTTVAAILALLPLALGVGQGSAMLRPLAVAIITGLLVQLPLVLIVLPALLALLGGDGNRGARRATAAAVE
jgi:CzcA family heavy metal efflux pump